MWSMLIYPPGRMSRVSQGTTQVLFEDWRGAGDGLGIHHWHGVPQVRVVCVGDGLGAIALDLSIPVRAFRPLHQFRSSWLKESRTARSSRFGNGGLACSDDVQGGGWHGTGEPVFDIGTCTTMLSEKSNILSDPGGRRADYAGTKATDATHEGRNYGAADIDGNALDVGGASHV